MSEKSGLTGQQSRVPGAIRTAPLWADVSSKTSSSLPPCPACCEDVQLICTDIANLHISLGYKVLVVKKATYLSFGNLIGRRYGFGIVVSPIFENCQSLAENTIFARQDL